MDLLLLLLIAFLLYIFVVPLLAAARAKEALRLVKNLEERLREANRVIAELRAWMRGVESAKIRDSYDPPKPPEAPVVVPARLPEPRVQNPPPLEEPPQRAKSIFNAPNPVPPPPVVVPPSPVVISPSPAISEPTPLNMEQFLGVKLFGWLGGLALFFGIAFFVKYSFERNLITPVMRVLIGYLLGVGLLVSGVVVHRRKAYTALAQTFCASGILILYGVTFAAHSIYELFGAASGGAIVAFGIMAMVTAVAFVLSVRLNALVVAVLGMVGGFLTPILCSTGQDRPLALFGYIALLDIGLLLVAKYRRWFFLASLGATGTILMQTLWFAKFFRSGHYDEGAATLIPMGIVIGFIALFTVAASFTRKEKGETSTLFGAALGLCGLAMVFAFQLLQYQGLTDRAFLFYGFIFLINIASVCISFLCPQFSAAQMVIGLATFAHLMVWTMDFLTTNLLPEALTVYLVFGILHAAVPVVRRKWCDTEIGVVNGFSRWLPPLVLVLLLLPIFRLDEVSFSLWPVVLVVDVIIIGMAFLSGMLLPVVVALVLSLLILASWLLRLQAYGGMEIPFISLLGSFGLVFGLAGVLLPKRFADREANDAAWPRWLDSALPICSAVLPFMLLIMAVVKLPLSNPSAVFGLGLAFALFLLGVARVTKIAGLYLVTLGCMLALEFTWLNLRFESLHPWTSFIWFAGLHVLFFVFPFCFHRALKASVLPWAMSALSGVGHFFLINAVVKTSFPAMERAMGLVPAAFAIPLLLGLFGILRHVKPEGDAKHGQLAWFGGVALFFITLIFPVQFDRQWLTLAWAMEGAALIWLFRHVPHRGLIYTGVVLLALAFVRLSFNPAVLEYYPRGDTPILNWHLYAYTIAALSCFLGARWMLSPHHLVGGINLQASLWAMGGALLFLLLNIEIADFFTEPGKEFITISFGGRNFARDMTYSIGWGLFALILLMIGFALKSKGVRYAGVGLLAVTLLKLFLHDLASLGSIYRIGALVAVAVIALLASFLYQRFLSRSGE